MTQTLTPALFKHCKLLYSLMLKDSKVENVQGDKLPVFRGRLYSTFRKTDISQGYYTPVFRTLEDSGCITIVQRGNRAVESVVVLHREPVEEMDLTDHRKPARVSGEDFERLRKDITNIRENLGGMNIVKALADLDKRLKKVENKIKREASKER